MKTLDKTERRVLLRKYMDTGLIFDKAIERVNKFHNYLKDLNSELKLQGKSKQDIEQRFRKEFYEMCQKLET